MKGGADVYLFAVKDIISNSDYTALNERMRGE
jgi:hypothetical protein